MDNAEMLTPKEVGKRIKERRNEIGISMPELGRRVGVNKSTIQRYETDGVNPNRSMIINGLADALQTTPEWLTGLSEEKEVKGEDGRTICEGEVLDHLNSFLDAVSKTVLCQGNHSNKHRGAAQPSGPMVVGRNEAGKLLVCHCSSGQNNVVVTEFAASGFTVVGRPGIYNT